MDVPSAAAAGSGRHRPDAIRKSVGAASKKLARKMAHNSAVNVPGRLKGLIWLSATREDVDGKHPNRRVAVRGYVALVEQAHRSKPRRRLRIAYILKNLAVAVHATDVVCLQRRPNSIQGPVRESLRVLDLESAVVKKDVEPPKAAVGTEFTRHCLHELLGCERGENMLGGMSRGLRHWLINWMWRGHGVVRDLFANCFEVFIATGCFWFDLADEHDPVRSKRDVTRLENSVTTLLKLRILIASRTTLACEAGPPHRELVSAGPLVLTRILHFNFSTALSAVIWPRYRSQRPRAAGHPQSSQPPSGASGPDAKTANRRRPGPDAHHCVEA
jgi:hypothetical protein